MSTSERRAILSSGKKEDLSRIAPVLRVKRPYKVKEWKEIQHVYKTLIKTQSYDLNEWLEYYMEDR